MKVSFTLLEPNPDYIPNCEGTIARNLKKEFTGVVQGYSSRDDYNNGGNGSRLQQIIAIVLVGNELKEVELSKITVLVA